MNQSGGILQKCTLFRGLSPEELDDALTFFHAREKHCRKGEYLHRAEGPLRFFGLLLSGNVQVFMDDFDGNQMLMASVTPGITFGEALCTIGQEASVYIQAVEESDVLLMDTEFLRQGNIAATPLSCELSRRFTAMMAERSLALNNRIQILSKGSIREKVITLLSEEHRAQNGDTIVLPFTREAMAVYLGVNQSALSRELSRMQAEGIIRFRGKVFELRRSGILMKNFQSAVAIAMALFSVSRYTDTCRCLICGSEQQHQGGRL